MNFLFVAQANFCPFAPTTLFVFSCEESGNGPAMLAKGFFFFPSNFEFVSSRASYRLPIFRLEKQAKLVATWEEKK